MTEKQITYSIFLREMSKSIPLMDGVDTLNTGRVNDIAIDLTNIMYRTLSSNEKLSEDTNLMRSGKNTREDVRKRIMEDLDQNCKINEAMRKNINKAIDKAFE